MSKDHHFTMDGHPVVFNGNSPRKLNIYFSEPDAGVNSETGMVLLIPGFGGSSQSNVYKKMRSKFADDYNLITIQCDYFGWEFMQTDLLEETPANFNDMGVMQALDNITAVMIISEIIKDNNLSFNAGKVIAYGHSHGAYLSYLSNIFAPSLFSLIIDNSAWLFPLYLITDRQLSFSNGAALIFNYLAKSIVEDFEILHLPNLYKNMNNQCNILSYHGSEDGMITIDHKKSFCTELNNCKLFEITPDSVDHKIFGSSAHGLQADYVLLFDHVIKQPYFKFQYKDNIHVKNQTIETSLYRYHFDYSNHLPVLNINPK